VASLLLPHVDSPAHKLPRTTNFEPFENSIEDPG